MVISSDTGPGATGLHGKQFLHLRTGYLIQMGRYLALTVFISLLAVCSAPPFIVGVAIAGMTSTIRQFLWLRRIPAIDAADTPPVALDTTVEMWKCWKPRFVRFKIVYVKYGPYVLQLKEMRL